MRDIFENKIILITGGCGSIGSELVRQLLQYNPKTIRILDNRETELFYMEHELSEHKNLRFFLGDIRDKERLSRAIKGVDIIFHTAALKHVSSCEFNPFEAVKTNVYGTNNVIENAVFHNVDKFINISTDKVTNTISTMGSTKLLAERLVASAQYWKGDKKTKLASVRFGNVLGSRGSVIDLFKNQIIDKGVITITDPDMTRFIMSIRQAVKLVLETVKEMEGGEIFILKMPVFRLEDLISIIKEHFMIKYNLKEIKEKVIGTRPGERKHEDLMTEQEAKKALETPDKFIILPQITNSYFDETIRNYKNSFKTEREKFSSKDITPLSKQELKNLILREGILD